MLGGWMQVSCLVLLFCSKVHGYKNHRSNIQPYIVILQNGFAQTTFYISLFMPIDLGCSQLLSRKLSFAVGSSQQNGAYLVNMLRIRD